jgi:ribonucleoside-diphosphate reductase alpha chain
MWTKDGSRVDHKAEGFLWNWESLRENVLRYGVRNSLLVAPMPTASTSQILGNNECIEPFTSNIYLRRTLAGEFVVVNKYLIRKLVQMNIWNDSIKNEIIKNNGSIQSITSIPEDIREVFKTVWEIGNKPLIDMAASRGRFICQSQSLNLFMDKPDFRKLSSMHFYSWRKGLKTGIYYLRTKPVAQAQQFTIEPEKRSEGGPSCSRDDQECLSCGS